MTTDEKLKTIIQEYVFEEKVPIKWVLNDCVTYKDGIFIHLCNTYIRIEIPFNETTLEYILQTKKLSKEEILQLKEKLESMYNKFQNLILDHTLNKLDNSN